MDGCLLIFVIDYFYVFIQMFVREDIVGLFDGVDFVVFVVQMGMLLYVYLVSVICDCIDELFSVLEGFDVLVCYVVKVNSNVVILQLMVECGLGVDIVFVGELWCSLQVGIWFGCIVFFGVGKIVVEMVEVLEVGIGCFNFELCDELEMLEQVVVLMGVVVCVVVCINFDVDVCIYVKIFIGCVENKFGVSLDEVCCWFDDVVQFLYVQLDGLYVYIGL